MFQKFIVLLISMGKEAISTLVIFAEKICDFKPPGIYKKPW